ncbi:MAG: TetR/AcrR family transcriptional regulator [Chloroflexi bacterium]|nr:MAG: TetR/AcrR family transcriptional regulator [Chloroflexota bacterium]
MSKDTKQQILDAANHLIEQEGVAALTLESVAAAAGVSKGGLLYHFPNKDALIEGMIAHLIQNFDERLGQSADFADWLAAYVRLTLADMSLLSQAQFSILAAIANNPDLVQPMADQTAAWQKRIESVAKDPVLATIIRLATDGLWYAEMLGIRQVSDEMKQAVEKRLLEMIHDSTQSE